MIFEFATFWQWLGGMFQIFAIGMFITLIVEEIMKGLRK